MGSKADTGDRFKESTNWKLPVDGERFNSYGGWKYEVCSSRRTKFKILKLESTLAADQARCNCKP